MWWLVLLGVQADLTLPPLLLPPPAQVSGPLGAVHLLSTDGIYAILSSLSASASGAAEVDPGQTPPLLDPQHYVDIWGPLCTGRNPPVLLAVSSGDGSGGVRREGSVAEAARAEKYLKGRLTTAAEHFNRDQKKGFSYLQASAGTVQGWGGVGGPRGGGGQRGGQCRGLRSGARGLEGPACLQASAGVGVSVCNRLCTELNSMCVPVSTQCRAESWVHLAPRRSAAPTPTSIHTPLIQLPGIDRYSTNSSSLHPRCRA